MYNSFQRARIKNLSQFIRKVCGYMYVFLATFNSLQKDILQNSTL